MGELGGSSPTANRKLEDRAQSPEMPIRPNNYLPLTICRTDPWQADVLDTEPSVVTKTEHEFSVSDIIVSRHGKLSRTSLRLGNLLRNEVVIGETLSTSTLKSKRIFGFPTFIKIALAVRRSGLY